MNSPATPFVESSALRGSVSIRHVHTLPNGKRFCGVSFEDQPPEWLRSLYRSGDYRFSPPPVCHAKWTENDWIRHVYFAEAQLLTAGKI